MKSLIKYFHCGQVYSKGGCFNYRVFKLDDLTQKIIPFFNNYPGPHPPRVGLPPSGGIIGVKALYFADWCQVVKLINEKKHLTEEGLNQIREIKAIMNRGRK